MSFFFQIFVRGVKGAIDMFRTALPNTAVEGGCSPESSSTSLKIYSEDSFSDHKFQEHLLEYSSRVSCFLLFIFYMSYIYIIIEKRMNVYSDVNIHFS